MTLMRSFFKVSCNGYRQINRKLSSHDIRNIGVLAHIDAGKTTTTERMLFYAGKTFALGEVHHGNTVTDYLAQERERGITICSSAVTFEWKGKRINLLDTPGHIDFTMEVEQSLHAVDGVVVVLDGTTGVEAQTLTVWRQAQKHHLPKIVFVNKMDRPDANFFKCVTDVQNKLDADIVCVQHPVKDDNGNLSIVDLVSLKRLYWESESLGRKYVAQNLYEEDENSDDFRKRRNQLIDRLSSVDDTLADMVISSNGFEKITPEELTQALRRTICEQKVVPILFGSAYKNVGIQPLIDAIVNYLPAANERNQLYDCFNTDFVGKVFKIVHDKQRGPLTLVRVFRGELKRGMRLSNTRFSTEIVSKIYEPLANEYREVNAVSAGDVAVCAGLKHTVTGDLLSVTGNALKNAKKKLRKMLGKNDNIVADQHDDEEELINEMFNIKPQIPDAVYFCAIEPPSLSSQKTMEQALRQLQREDPSLRVSYDAITGQTVLGGMGELHMEIIKSRILSEYKIEVELGPLQIAYKETIDKPLLHTWHVEKEIAGIKQSVSITMKLLKTQKDIFSVDKSPENVAALNALRPRFLQVIRKGALSALERGPLVGGQVVDTQICLHSVSIGRGTADSFVMASAAQCVQKLLTLTGTHLLEPIMSLQIVTPSEYISAILADLSRRRGLVVDVQQKSDKNKVILVNAPLAELSGYSSFLRTKSSGNASMTMQPCGFANMNANDVVVAIRRVQGLE